MSADFWAGYISGAAGIIIGNPLDLIKTRLQAGKTAPQHVVEATTTATGGGAIAPTATAAVQPQLQTLQGFKAQFENAGTLVRGKLRRALALPSTKSNRESDIATREFIALTNHFVV